MLKSHVIIFNIKRLKATKNSVSIVIYIQARQDSEKFAFIAKYRIYIYVYQTFTIYKGSIYLIMIKRISINKRKHILRIS